MMDPHVNRDSRLHRLMQEVVDIDDLARKDWRSQTDIVRYTLVIVALYLQGSQRFWMVDGRIERGEITKAINNRRGAVKGYFSQRCHQYGLTCSRLIVFDTKSKKGLGRGNHVANLHFHGFFLLPEGESEVWLRKKLKLVFGEAVAMGPYQLRFTQPNFEKKHSYKERAAYGPLGKLNYVLGHAGSTYAKLELNEGGQRSRKAPSDRRKRNKNSKGIAAGIPSNFLSSVVICDSRSKSLAKTALKDWVADQTDTKSVTSYQNETSKSA